MKFVIELILVRLIQHRVQNLYKGITANKMKKVDIFKYVNRSFPAHLVIC